MATPTAPTARQAGDQRGDFFGKLSAPIAPLALQHRFGHDLHQQLDTGLLWLPAEGDIFFRLDNRIGELFTGLEILVLALGRPQAVGSFQRRGLGQ
jgi:hypothetical protein